MKWRLAIAFLSFTFAVLLVQDLPLVSYFSGVEEDRIVTSLERDSFILAARAQDTLAEGGTEMGQLQDDLDRYQVSTGTRILVTNAIGTVIADTQIPGTNGSSLASHPGIRGALQGTVTTGRTTQAGEELVYVAIPVTHSDTVYGAVLNTYPVPLITRAVNQRLGIIATIAGLSLGVAALISVLLARSITRSIEELEGTTVDFALGNFSARADTRQGDPEIQSLAASFNAMADQLTRLIEQQRAFAGDASHQLRTPLTALHLRLENAREIAESDPQEAVARIDAALDEAERLQMIIEGLLVLSRADSTSYPDTVRIDVTQVARDRTDSWQALADDSDVKVELQAPNQACWVRAVPNAVEQVIDNYVDNALAVSPPGSTITITIDRRERYTAVHVLDQGPGLAEQDLERAFHRFWRGRSDSSGSGLGLAIVERLTTVSGGRARLSNRQPTGLDAQADFPNA